MRQAYRDPDEAWGRLHALEQAEGGPLGAERALSRHGGAELLGELRGKTGWLASKAAKAERETAERCAGAVGRGLIRLREFEAGAGQSYVARVDAQRARDAVEVPGLSPAAWAAVRAVEMAGTPEQRQGAAQGDWNSRYARYPAVASAWAQEGLGRPGVEAELRAVVDAATKRLGEDGARDLMRNARAAGDGAGRQQGLSGIGQVLAATGEGERAHAAQHERAREAERERLGLRQGRGMRM